MGEVRTSVRHARSKVESRNEDEETNPICIRLGVWLSYAGCGALGRAGVMGWLLTRLRQTPTRYASYGAIARSMDLSASGAMMA